MVTAASVTLDRIVPASLDDAVDVYASTWFRPLPPAALVRFRTLIAHLQATDPDGAWIASRDGVAIAIAIAHARGRLWVLSALFVRPEEQVQGLGRRLLQRVLSRDDASRGLIPSSGDPRATRLYASAGFDTQPAMRAHGRAVRGPLPAGLRGRAAELADAELMAEVDLRIRGSARSADLAQLLTGGARGLVLERGAARGYVLFREGTPPVDGIPLTLVASDDEIARALLWQALAEAEDDVLIDGLTASHRWAFDVAHAARLAVIPSGALFSRGFSRLPSPWLLSPFFA